MGNSYVVYVAGPLTDGGELCSLVMQRHVRRAQEVGTMLADRGFAPIVPHSMWHWGVDRPHDWYMRVCLPLVERCDVLLRLDGESLGAATEVAHALVFGKRVVHEEGDLEKAIQDLKRWWA